MIETISMIVGISSALFSFVNENKITNESRKNKIADFMTNIADTLEMVADKLSLGEVPHGACDAIKEYALIFAETLDGYMERGKAEEYAQILLCAHNVEMLVLETRTDKQSIEMIRLASWRINVAAQLLRIKE